METCWAHNPEVDGSKPFSATNFIGIFMSLENTFRNSKLFTFYFDHVFFWHLSLFIYIAVGNTSHLGSFSIYGKTSKRAY